MFCHACLPWRQIDMSLVLNFIAELWHYTIAEKAELMDLFVGNKKKCPLSVMRMEMWTKGKCNQLIPKNLFVI
jgi:hypothetical protein